mmetsp:Transcript_2678/g.4195  ORF Transcript_2678/g.4195 Transcript_2678/m.4195 type:complete len:267 (-) Transcript_2678:214-1014(-)
MLNYMNCNQMMFGPKVKYSVTYKTNQRSFDIYRRRYWHNFKAPLNEENLEGSIGLEFATMRTFLVSKIDSITMYDTMTFEPFNEVPINLLKADTREPNQVIAMVKDLHEQYLGVISGKFLIKNEQKINQLFIFEREASNDLGRHSKDTFSLLKRVVLKDLPIFKQVSLNFHFKLTGNVKKDTLIFAKIDCLFELNFETEQVTTIFKFDSPFRRQPNFFEPNFDQTIFMVASSEDGLYINLPHKFQMDIDSQYDIDQIRAIIYDGED